MGYYHRFVAAGVSGVPSIIRVPRWGVVAAGFGVDRAWWVGATTGEGKTGALARGHQGGC